MGKLIDKLERMQKTEGPRMGFGAGSSAKQAGMALMGVLAEADGKLAAAAIEGGADSLLVSQAKGTKSGGSLSQALGVAESIPRGAQLVGTATADGGGWDFVVLEAADPVGSVLEAQDVDKVLRLEADPSDSLLRALESLPVDAVLLPELPDPLTLQGLIPYYRVTRSTSKPVLAFLSAAAGETALGALRDAGIIGVLVSVESAAQAKKLAGVRKAIDDLPPKKPKGNRSRLTATLGLQATPPAENAGPEPQEDDEDEEDYGGLSGHRPRPAPPEEAPWK